MRRFVLVAFFISLLFVVDTFGQVSGDYRSVATGNWSNAGTWQTYNGSSWVAASTAPNSSNGVITIQAGHTVSVDANVTVDQVVIASTATLNVNGSVVLTIADGAGSDLLNNGTLSISAGGGFPPGPSGTIQVNGSLVHAGSSFTGSSTTTLFFNAGSFYDHQVSTNQNLPIATWNATSTCELSGSNGNAKPNNLNQAFGNFIWNFPANGYTGGIDLNGDLSNIGGDLTISSTGSAFNYLGLSAGTNKTISIGGNLTWGSGTYGYVTSAATVTVNVGGDFSCSSSQFFMNNTGTVTIDIANNFSVPSGGSFDFTFSTGAANVNVGGDLDFGNGTILKSGSGTATLTIDGTTDQNLLSSVNNLIAFDTQISNTSSASLNFGIYSYQTGGNYSVSNLAALDLGTGYIGGAGNFTLASGSTLRVGSTHANGAMQTGTTAGNVRISGTRTYTAGANIIYNGAGAQVIGNGFPTTAVNLEIDNNAGVTNTAGATNIIGDLRLTNGSFNIGTSSSLDIQSNFIVTGGTIGGSTSSDLSFSGSGTLNNLVMTSGSSTLNNLTNARSATLTIGGTLTVKGTLDLTGNLDFSGQSLELDGTMTGAGGLISSSSSDLTIGGTGAFGTIGFSGTNSLNSLTLNRTSTGTYTIGSNVTLVSALNLNFGELTNNGGLNMGTGSTIYKGQGTVINVAPTATTTYDLVYNATANTSLESTPTSIINNVEVASGTVSLQNNLIVNGDLTLTSGTLAAGTNDITMAGTSKGIIANGGSLNQSSSNSLKVSGTIAMSGTSIDGLQTGNLDITGSLTAASGATLNVSGFLNNNGTFIANGSTVNFNGSSSSITGATTTTFHSLSVGSGSTLTSSSGTVNLTGDFTNSGTFAGTGGTINFQNTAASTINVGSSAFNNLTIAGSGSVTLAAALDVNGDLTLTSGTLDVTNSNYNVNLAGNWNNNGGTFNERQGTVFFDGTNSTIGGSASTNFYNLEVSNGTVRVNGTATLTNTLTLAASTTFDADGTGSGTFTLLSNASTDARIAAIPGSAVITGNLTFERYLPAYGSKRWRNIGSAVAGASVADMQNEIMISGNFTGNNNIALGLTDPLGPNSIQSLAGYDESVNAGLDNDWVNFPSATNTETFAIGKGYSIYVRSTGAVTFDLRGTVNQGSIALPVSGTGDLWNLVSNPYPSSIDWDNASGWTKTSIQGNGIAVWNGLQYLTWNGSTGSLNNGRIPMGMAFWVQATNASVGLTINENAKTATTGTVQRALMPTSVELSLTGINYDYTDKTHILLDPESTNELDIHDLGKLPNSIFNLYTTSKDGKDLSINSISNFICGEEIPINITNLWVDDYRMEWAGLETIDSDMEIFIKDNLDGTLHNLRSDSSFIISVTAAAEIYDTLGTETNPQYTYQIKNRFSLVVKEKDFSANLAVIGSQICTDEPSASITIQGSEEGVLYDILNDAGTIAQAIGTGSDLEIILGDSLLANGDNNFRIAASRGACNYIEFDNPVPVNIISKPVLTFDEVTNSLSTDASGSLQWYDGDMELVGETGSSINVDLYHGEHIYSVKAFNNSCEKTSEVYLVTGIETDLTGTGIEVFPNPVSNKIHINLEKSAISNVLLRILSSDGRVVFQRDRFSGQLEVDASRLESGMYLVEITDATSRYVTRVVKQ